MAVVHWLDLHDMKVISVPTEKGKTMREKLIELLRDVQYLGGLEEKIADHLIANGVTILTKPESKKINIKLPKEIVVHPYKPKWIPVTKMYPRLECYIYSVDVMFLLASGDVRIGYVNYESEKWKCRDSSRLFNKDDVTHWMPLPEAPKE